MSLEYLDISSGALTKYHHKHLWLGPAAKLQHVCGRVDRPTVSKALTTIHNPQQVVTNVYKCSMMFYAPVPSTKLSIQEIQDGYILTVATHWQEFFIRKSDSRAELLWENLASFQRPERRGGRQLSELLKQLRNHALRDRQRSRFSIEVVPLHSTAIVWAGQGWTNLRIKWKVHQRKQVTESRDKIKRRDRPSCNRVRTDRPSKQPLQHSAELACRFPASFRHLVNLGTVGKEARRPLVWQGTAMQ